MFIEVVNHNWQRNPANFGSPQMLKEFHKLQKIKRITKDIFDAICNDDYDDAECSINELPYQPLKERSRNIIKKIKQLQHQLEDTKTSKDQLVQIEVQLTEKEKKNSQMYSRLQSQFEEKNKATVIKSQNNSSVRNHGNQFQDQEDQMQELKKKYMKLNKNNAYLMSQNEKVRNQYWLTQKKLGQCKRKINRLRQQYKELKLKANVALPRQSRTSESSMIPSESNRSHLQKVFQEPLILRQIEKNSSEIKEYMIGPGQGWQLRSNNSRLTISIKESDPAQHIQYFFLVRIEKKVKSGLAERSSIQEEVDNKARRNSDSP